MSVWQLRCDKFVVFFAREVYILSLRSPGVTKDLRRKLTKSDLSKRSRETVFMAVTIAGKYSREVMAAEMRTSRS